MRRFESSLSGPAKRKGGYRLVADGTHLEVEYVAEHPVFCSGEMGFIEGLWRFDCGELFLIQPSTGRYLELNIAPTGAWWSCVFVDVRVRDLGLEPPQIGNITTESAGLEWRAGFRLELSEIERCLGSARNLRGNVTLIIGGCPDDNPPLENLHSVAELGAVDFHRPKEWLPIEHLLT